MQCGKTYSILPPICNYVEPVLMGSDASGRILAYIENPTTNDIHGVFKGEGAADEYALVSPMEKRIFKSPDGGVVWSREALASNPITVKPQQEFVIVFDSTIKEIPEGYTVADITATNDADANTHGLVVATSQGGIPVIDGNLGGMMTEAVQEAQHDQRKTRHRKALVPVSRHKRGTRHTLCGGENRG